MRNIKIKPNEKRQKMKNKLHNMSTTQLILSGYCLIILAGALLLMLPFATKGEGGAHFLDALFTATSATCVTGLVMHDTYTYWSLFGQIVILLLIQLGGLGFMTITISLISLTKKRIGLKQRMALSDSVAAPHVGGIVRMTKFIVSGSLLTELFGTVMLSIRFVPKLGLAKGIYFGLFHSVSAFCNAGIDLMGNFSEYSSFMTADVDIRINLTIKFLIVFGGLGFFVWSDIREHKFNFKSYRLHTKIVLTTTALLIILGTVAIMSIEYGSEAMEGKNFFEKLLISLFQSVTCRTAGFNTVDLTALHESTQFIMIMLMMIGGSPGSTAGGLKTTTFAVLLLSILGVFKKRKSLECYKRRIEEEALHNACCVLMLYLILACLGAIMVSVLDSVSFISALFETVSALGTVGLSLGITPALGAVSHVILIMLMIVGRIGGISVLLAFSGSQGNNVSTLPAEKIAIG